MFFESDGFFLKDSHVGDRTVIDLIGDGGSIAGEV